MSNLGLLGMLGSDPLAFVFLAVALLGAIALHEYAHALAADLQGDRLPRAMGRLTLNPARHLDPLGTLFIFLVGFGWGKPVEFRRQALSSQRFGAALVALAGPMMNLVLAFAGAVVLGLVDRAAPAARFGEGLTGQVFTFLDVFVAINILLAVFNLVPLPPLDGSRLLTIFLPPHKQHIIFWLDRYGFLVLLALVLFGGLRFIAPLIQTIGGLVLRLAGVQ